MRGREDTCRERVGALALSVVCYSRRSRAGSSRMSSKALAKKTRSRLASPTCLMILSRTRRRRGSAVVFLRRRGIPAINRHRRVDAAGAGNRFRSEAPNPCDSL